MDPNKTKPILARAIARIGTRAAATATAILWCIAIAWYGYRAIPNAPHVSTAAYDFAETLLLALACLGFQLAALRVGADHLTRIWHATMDAGSAARDPVRWRVFGWIGVSSWLVAVSLGIPLATNAWNPDSTTLIFALVIILIPAVQCTGAAIVGPILTHVARERETAIEARLRIRAATESAVRVHRKVRNHGLR